MSTTTSSDASARVAAHVAGTAYDELPADAIAAAKRFTMDSFGVALAGSRGPWMATLAANASVRAAAAGSSARVWGHRGLSATPSRAAMLNACQIHNSEFDCVHEPAVVHALAVLLGGLGAWIDASGRPVSGRELLRAVVLGVDVAAGLGLAARSGLRFFRPGTAGAFGATAAIGAVEGFDEATLSHAFGLAYAQACGTMQAHTEGLPLLALQVGMNARNAFEACELAGAGVTATEGTLEGDYGYFALFEPDSDLQPVLDSLGRVHRIAEVAHKPFPSGRATHGIVDACLALQAEHELAADDIAAVVAQVPPLTHRLVGRPQHDAMTANYARLCGTFVTAAALRARALGIADFDPERLTDADTLELGTRISIVPDDNPDPNALTPLTVAMTLRDGRTLERHVDVIYGHPDRPMTRDAQLAKFHTNWAAARAGLDPAQAEHFVGLCDNLERVDDVRELLALIAPPEP